MNLIFVITDHFVELVPSELILNPPVYTQWVSPVSELGVWL